MARYGLKFKQRAVARLLPPESAAISTVSQELGVSVATLERWRADALSMPARERAWTAVARLQAVIATAALDEAQRNAWCREQGVYPTELEQWKLDAIAALGEPTEERVSAQQVREDKKRIKELERDLKRKDKALAEAAALLVLSKHVWSAHPTQVISSISTNRFAKMYSTCEWSVATPGLDGIRTHRAS